MIPTKDNPEISNPPPKAIDRLLASMRFAKVKPYIPKGARLLDVGTGDSSFLRKLNGYVDSAVGIDPLLKTPVAFGTCRLVPGYFPQDLVNDESFDVITMLATIEHIPSDRLSAVEETCWKLLSPGRQLIITVPHPIVDKILYILKFFRFINGLALEEHYGFVPETLSDYFRRWKLVKKARWQLGCNYLFVFEKK